MWEPCLHDTYRTGIGTYVRTVGTVKYVFVRRYRTYYGSTGSVLELHVDTDAIIALRKRTVSPVLSTQSNNLSAIFAFPWCVGVDIHQTHFMQPLLAAAWKVDCLGPQEHD